ncbi:hypothetical protein HY989_02185 [Candidatus Micrarchaeota archaeon]|nr:hypothetical protein [Candidatus Micrarchaeota archaeon]
MWKIIAVFLLMLILAATSLYNKEGLSWILMVFFAIFGIGLFIYTQREVLKTAVSNKKIKEIKNEMGTPTFEGISKLKEEVREIETPKFIELDHPAQAKPENALDAPKIELPPVDLENMVPKDVPDSDTTPIVPIDISIKTKKDGKII